MKISMGHSKLWGLAILAAALLAPAHAETLGGQTVYPLQRTSDGSSATTPDSINAEDSTKTALPPATWTPPPPPPAPPPASCTVNPGDKKNWVVNSYSCTGVASIGSTSVTVAHGALQLFNDTTTVYVGRSNYICDNGTLLPYNDGSDVPLCRPAVGCTIGKSTSKTWTVGGKTCTTTAKTGVGSSALPVSGSATVPHEGTWTFTDIFTPLTGSATFTCNDGVLAASPDAGATCDQVPLGSDCVFDSVGATVNWTVGNYSCTSGYIQGTGDSTDGVTDTTVGWNFIHHGASRVYTDSTGSPTGVAAFGCADGALKLTPNAGATCGPTSCTVAAGTARSWTVGANTCTATTTASSTVTHGSKLVMTDATADPAKGKAEFVCTNGTLSSTAVTATAHCSATFTSCSVAAGTTLSWMNPAGTRSCSGTVASATTVAHNANLRVSDTVAPGLGAAYFTCVNGVLQTTPNPAMNQICKP